MRSAPPVLLPWLLGVIAFGFAGTAIAAADEDTFIQGYATAILERDFSLTRVTVRVNQGILTLSADSLQDKDRDKVVAALSRIKGVRKVVVLQGNPDARPEPGDAQTTGGGWTLFPEERLFSPLLADPRWPHFSLGYAYFRRSGVPSLRNVALVSVGEQLNLVGFQSDGVGKFDVGLQPAVFGLFNIDAFSHDLVNADYRIAVPMDYRYGFFSAEARVFHQSSHLGDEFLLDTPIQRINLSYEGMDLRISGEWNAFRLYLGAGKIVNSEPALRPWSAQQGLEFVSVRSFLNDSVRPVVAADLQEREENGWQPDLSLRAGVEFSSPEKGRHRVQLLLEYYRGHNPNGQFYRERIETIGLGIHVYF